VKVAIIGDASKLRSAVDDANGALGSLGKGFSAIGGLAKSAALGVAALGGGIVAAGMAAKPLIDAASDMNETISKVGVIFGEAAKPIQDFAKNATRNFGLSERAALDASATMAVFGKAAGLSGNELVSFSTDMVGLAGDLRSFFNTSPEDAIAAIGAALRGESEPIRRYGVLLDDATLRARAFEMGLISSVKEGLTPAQRALAAQAEILAQTTDAQGDFARTADSAANRQDRLAAEVDNLKSKLGQALLPTFTKLLGFLIDKVVPAIETHVVPAMGQLAQFIETKVVPALQSAVEWVRTNWPTIQSVILTVVDAIRTAIVFVVDEVIPRLVAAFQAVVVFVQKHWPKVAEVAGKVFDAIRTAIVFVVDEVIPRLVAAFQAVVVFVQKHWPTIQSVILTVFDRLVAAFQAVVEFVQQNWPKVAEVAGKVFDAIVKAVGVVVAYVKGRWPSISETISDVMHNVETVVRANVRAVVDVVQALWPLISETISNVMHNVETVVRAVVGVVQALWSTFGDTILSYAQGAWNGIVRLIQGALFIIRGAFDVVLGALSLDWQRVFDGLSGIASGNFEILKGVIALGTNAILTSVRLGLDALSAVFSRPFEIAASALFGIFERIKNGFRAAINFVIRAWNNIEFKVPKIFGYGGFTIGTPNIPELAAGGIVTSPTLAVVGESGPEAVIPLQRMGDMGGNTYNIQVTTLDARTAGDVVVDAITAWERRNGKTWRAA